MFNFLQYIARSETLPCSDVHFFRLQRAAIRYALGANLGEDQTVMLDWSDDEKMTLEKLLPGPVDDIRRLYFEVVSWVFTFSLECFSEKPEPSLAEEFGQKLNPEAEDYDNCLALDMLWILSHSQHIKMDKLAGLSHVENIFTINLFSSHLPIFFLVVLSVASKWTLPKGNSVRRGYICISPLWTRRCICLTPRPLFHFSYDPPSVRGRVWALHCSQIKCTEVCFLKMHCIAWCSLKTTWPLASSLHITLHSWLFFAAVNSTSMHCECKFHCTAWFAQECMLWMWSYKSKYKCGLPAQCERVVLRAY